MKKFIPRPVLLALALSACGGESVREREARCLSIASAYDHVAAIAMGETEIAFDFYAADGRRRQGRFKAVWDYRHVKDLSPGAHMGLDLKTAWRAGRCEGIAFIHEPPAPSSE